MDRRVVGWSGRLGEERGGGEEKHGRMVGGWRGTTAGGGGTKAVWAPLGRRGGGGGAAGASMHPAVRRRGPWLPRWRTLLPAVLRQLGCCAVQCWVLDHQPINGM